MKKLIVLSFVVAVLMTACSSESDNSSQSYTYTHTTPPTIAFYPPTNDTKITDKTVEDYVFSGEVLVYSQESGTTEYSGEISDLEKVSIAWDFIVKMEAQATCELDADDTLGEDHWNVLTLTDKKTGEETTIREAILYRSPENEGGPEVFVVSGPNRYECYEKFERDDGELNRLETLLVEVLSVE